MPEDATCSRAKSRVARALLRKRGILGAAMPATCPLHADLYGDQEQQSAALRRSLYKCATRQDLLERGLARPALRPQARGHARRGRLLPRRPVRRARLRGGAAPRANAAELLRRRRRRARRRRLPRGAAAAALRRRRRRRPAGPRRGEARFVPRDALRRRSPAAGRRVQPGPPAGGRRPAACARAAERKGKKKSPTVADGPAVATAPAAGSPRLYGAFLAAFYALLYYCTRGSSSSSRDAPRRRPSRGRPHRYHRLD